MYDMMGCVFELDIAEVDQYALVLEDGGFGTVAAFLTHG